MPDGPGGREVGRVSIRVVPDTSRFGRELRRDLERIERTLKIEIPTTADTRGLETQVIRAARRAQRAARIAVPVRAETARAEAQIARVARDRRATIRLDIDRRSLRQAGGLFGRALIGGVPIQFDQIGRIATSWPGLLVIASIVGALAQVTGLLALVPSLAFGSAAAVGVLVAAFVGLSSSAVPAVKETLRELSRLRPAWRRVQETIRGRLFDGLAREIRELAQVWLPLVEHVAGRIAGAFNAITRELSRTLRVPQTLRDTEVGFNNFADAMLISARSVDPIVRALRDLAVVGSAFLPGMAHGFADLAESFAKFVAEARESGALAQFIERGLDAAGKLIEGTVSLTRIIGGIGRAAVDIGAFDALVRVLGAIADVINSDGGQNFLGQMFTNVKDAIKALQPAIGPVAEALGAIALALGPVMVDAAEALAAILIAVAPVVEKMAPHLGNIASFFLNPQIVASILAGATAFKVFGGALRIAVGALTLFGIATTLPIAPLALLAAAVMGLAALIILKFEPVRQFLGRFFVEVYLFFRDWKSVVAEFIVWFKGKWDGFIEWVKKIPRRIVGAFGRPDRLLIGVGEDIVRGLIRGLGNMAGSLSNKAKGLAGSVLGPFQGILQIRSPSRVFEKMGIYIGEGLALGIEASAKRVDRAAASLGMRTMALASAGVMSGAGSVTFSPTINAYNPAPEPVSNTLTVQLRRLQHEWGF